MARKINYPKGRRSAPCPPGCECGKHRSREMSAETRAKISAASKARGYNHQDGCICVWCGPNPAVTRHGETSRTGRSVEYLAWQNMRARCLNPRNPRYADYGGRGITVCDRWLVFVNFLADVGRRPGPGYSIDRIDNDGHYEPGNCRWATASEQRRNKRPVHQKSQKLTDEDREWINSGVGLVSYAMMADALGVSESAVARVVVRR